MLAGWLFGGLVGWLVNWWVGWLFVHLVGWFVGCLDSLVCRFINRLAGRFFQGLIVLWVGCLWVRQSVLWTVSQLLGRLIVL